MSNLTTPKQRSARERNWDIKIIRGCYWNIKKLRISERLKEQLLTGLESALEEYGAETEHIRYSNRVSERNSFENNL